MPSPRGCPPPPPSSPTAEGAEPHRPKRAIAAGFLISGTGQGLGLLVSFATISVLTRYLGERGYGTYLTAYVFLMTLTTASHLGISTVQLHLMARGELDEARVVGGVLGLRILLGAVVMAAAPLLVRALGYSQDANALVLLGAAGFFFVYLSAGITPVYEKHLAMKRSSAVVLIERVLLLLLVLGCVALGLGVSAVMLCAAASQAAAFAAHLVLARPLVAVWPRCEPAVWAAVLRQGWPMATLSVLALACLQGDMLLLPRYRDAAEVGLYGLPNRLLGLVVGNVPALFMALMLPQLTRAWHLRERDAFRDLLQTTFDFFVLALVPFTVAALTRAEDIVVFVGGQEFASSAAILEVRTLAVIGLFFGLFYRYVSLAVERQVALVGPSLLVSIATVGAYFALIPEHGMWGAAWTRVLHAVAGAVVSFAVVYPIVRHRPRLGTACRALAAGGLMAAALLLNPEVHVVADLLIGLSVYGVGLLATGALRPTAIRALLSALRSGSGPLPTKDANA
jgi:O-antigen/teichoic acid export membrane protein